MSNKESINDIMLQMIKNDRKKALDSHEHLNNVWEKFIETFHQQFENPIISDYLESGKEELCRIRDKQLAEAQDKVVKQDDLLKSIQIDDDIREALTRQEP